MKPTLKPTHEYITLWQSLLVQQKAEYEDATNATVKARWGKRIAETEKIISKLEAKVRQAERRANGTGTT